MTAIDLVKTVRLGLHSSATDFSATPGTRPFLDPTVAGVLPPDTDRNEVETFRGDAMDSPSIVGVKLLPELQIDVQLRGISGNDGSAHAASTDTEVGLMLDSISGVAAVDPAGAATTVTGDTGGSSLLNVTSDADVVAGEGVLFATTVGGVERNVVREVVSKAANVLTLDRDWTDGAPGVDAVLYRSSRWFLNEAVSSHIHACIEAEGQDWFRRYVGCQGSLILSGEEGKPVMLQTRWRPTDWADAGEPDAAFSAPTAGNFIMNINGGIWVGDEKFMFKGWQLDTGLVINPAGSISGPNGVQGYKVSRKRPVLTGMLYFGTGGASAGELADSAGNISFNKIQGLTTSAGAAKQKGTRADTYDIALQVDDRPGAALYVRMPAAELSGVMAIENGLEMINLTAKPRRPASGSPMRLHLF